MPTSWPEFLLVAGVLALFGLAGNIVAGLINQKIPSLHVRTVALCAVGFVAASVAFAAYQAVRSAGPDAADVDATPTTADPAAPQSSSAAPRPSSGTPNRPDGSASATPGHTRTEYVVSVNSSTTGTMPEHPSSPTYRYWYYKSANDVIGEIRYEPSGGATGRWGWVPVAVGRDCTVPYVMFSLTGLPKGTYEVSVHVPDVPNLADQVEYGETIVDQAANRGSWVSLGRQKVTDDNREIGVTQSQPHASFGESSGCRRSEQRIAYDAVRARKV
ncbi:hypothetical protein ABZ738_19875 [Micromonospora sp. NPDC047793]|uniref:hypothetical protein n=1 Tax=Micromonospora sp. NPDC047793 TaxID=3154342 RepID=UPI00340E4E41